MALRFKEIEKLIKRINKKETCDKNINLKNVDYNLLGIQHELY